MNKNMENSLSTIVTKIEHYIAASLLIQHHSVTTGKGIREQTVDESLWTTDTYNRYGTVMTFFAKFYRVGTGQNMLEPIHTILQF